MTTLGPVIWTTCHTGKGGVTPGHCCKKGDKMLEAKTLVPNTRRKDRLEWPMRRSGGTKLPIRDKWLNRNEILSLEEMDLEVHY